MRDSSIRVLGAAPVGSSAPTLRWVASAVALSALALLAGCGREVDLPPLPPASLNQPQSEALQRMNTAGTTAFAGWTWRYEFGAGCRLRVVKRFEGNRIPVIEHVLVDHYLKIVPYPGSGFGVKAYPHGKAGSADLFDALSEAQAAAFGKDVERLTAACRSGAPLPNKV